MQHDRPLRIGILGAGLLGGTLGRLWARRGHHVMFSSRHPERLAGLVADAGATAAGGTIVEAARFGDVVLLAVPYGELSGVLASVERQLDGKVVVDAANPGRLSPDGRLVNALPAGGPPAGVLTARRLPRARVVRAFSHVAAESYPVRGRKMPMLLGVAVAGDDPSAKQVVERLTREIGFTPVDLGGLADSAPLDPGGALWAPVTAGDLRARLAPASPAAPGT
jgi:hypothetical protein